MVRFGPYEVRPSTRELFRQGVRVKLPPQAFEVLRVLLERRGELVTRQDFHRVLWPADTFVDFDQGLNNAIKRIREVLNDSAESPRYIETLPRLGYRFIAEVDWAQPNKAAEEKAPAPTNGPAVAVETDQGNEASLEAPAAPTRRKPLATSFLVGAVVVGVLALAWLFRPYYPKPRITGAVQLTADGIPKWGPLATDGLRIYFTEILNGQQTIAAIPLTGGQAVPLKMPFAHAGLYDISSDKTELLVVEANDMFEEAPLWRVPVIGGTPRRLGNIVAHDATWSPDGKKLAYATGNGVYLANADGSDPRTLVAPRPVHDEWTWRPAWSRDSQRLRFAYYEMQNNGSLMWEVNADGSKPHALSIASEDSPMQAFGDWTPDGRYYIFTSWRDLESGIPWPAANLWAVRERASLFHRASVLPEQLTVGPTRYFVHTLSLDGKTIFALSSHKHGELMRYDARTKNFSLYASGLSVEGVNFSQDGKWVAYVTYPQGELWRSRIDGSEPLRLSRHPLFASTPTWSPDGRQIAFNGGRAGEPSHSYLVSAEGDEPRLIDKIGEGVDPGWSPDGSSLVFTNESDNGMIRVLNLRTGSVVPVPESKAFQQPRLSPDGYYIAALSTDLQRLLLFDVRTQAWRELAQGNDIEWPRWSRDSKYIYFERTGPEREIFRVSLEGGAPELIVSLKDFHTTGADPAWFSLTPEGDILFLHDTGGSTEIYALSWDAP